MKKKPLQGLRTAIYAVDDLSKAKAWYAHVTGQDPYFDQPFYVGFNVGGYELGLIPNDTLAKEKGDSVYTYWGVEDAHAEYDRLVELGATPHEKPQDVGDGIVVAAVKDPWGNILGVIRNPHFKLEDAGREDG